VSKICLVIQGLFATAVFARRLSLEKRIQAIVRYGLVLVAKETLPAGVNWQAYEETVGEVNATADLLSALSLVHLKDKTGPPKSAVTPRPLALQTLIPQISQGESVTVGFQREWEKASQRYSENSPPYFLAFYNLFRKYAWALPSQYGGAGVSLFEQWKAVAAMLFASGNDWQRGPAAEFTLVGGDIPGIQDFVYTITSKGAAKGLRGRSFFVQLLGEAVIERLLSELDLSAVNVIYAAGGNFMLLAPRSSESIRGKTVEAILEQARAEMEKALLDEFRGDLALSLAWTPLPAAGIGSHDFAAQASRTLKELIAERKRARFGGVAKTQWEALFAPQGKPGNRYCAVCQTPLAKGEGKPLPGGEAFLCQACDSFGELARSLGKASFLSIGNRPPSPKERWQEALFKVSGRWFSFDQHSEVVYALNDTDFLRHGVHGFRFLANVTPHVTQADLDRWQAEPEEGETEPHEGDVRTFSQMSADAEGVHGIGVLRMDVDNLGQVMVGGLKPRTMAATSALSSALDMFFAGYLNIICAEIQKERPETLYVIYSGGDDLFILGAWDRMPELAAKIQAEFGRYTGGNPSLTISGAATLEGAKFPLYQAAERAGQAEDRAKAYRRPGNGTDKNAFHFLGLEVGWEEWDEVLHFREDIRIALAGGASRSLLQILQDIHAQYEHQRAKTKVELGPWIWRGAYALSRLAGRIPKENQQAREAVTRLAQSCLRPSKIRFAGLAARWVELLERKEK